MSGETVYCIPIPAEQRRAVERMYNWELRPVPGALTWSGSDWEVGD